MQPKWADLDWAFDEIEGLFITSNQIVLEVKAGTSLFEQFFKTIENGGPSGVVVFTYQMCHFLQRLLPRLEFFPTLASIQFGFVAVPTKNPSQWVAFAGCFVLQSVGYFANLVMWARFYRFSLVITGNIIYLSPGKFARLKLLPNLCPFRLGDINPRVSAEKGLLYFAEIQHGRMVTAFAVKNQYRIAQFEP